MPIVSPKILNSLIKEGPIVAPLALWVWAHAYRTPEAVGVKSPLGVRVDGIKGAASLLNANPRTVEKYWPRFCELFEKGPDGLFRPRPSAWPVESTWPTTSGGFYRYIQIGSSSVVRLMKLGSSRSAWSCQRLALSLLSPAGGAKGAGRRALCLSSSLLTRWLGMGKPAQRRALRSLRTLGLLRLTSESPRRACIESPLFSDRSRWVDLSFPQAVEKAVKNDPAEIRATYPPSIRGIKREDKNKGASRLAVISVFQNSLLGIRRSAAIKLASFCDSSEQAADWIESESDLLEVARNPAAAFLWAFDKKKSRPGSPSGSFKSQAIEKRALAAELMIARKRTDEEKATDKKERAESIQAAEFIQGESAAIWTEASMALRAEVGAWDFNHWLKPARALWDGEVLTLATIDAASAEALETHWGEEIRRAVGVDFKAVAASQLI